RELSFGIRRGEGIELGASSRGGGIILVDRADLDDRQSAALIATRGRIDQIALSYAELTNEHRRDPRITSFSEITIGGSPHESAVTGWFKPTPRFAAGDDLHWGLLLLYMVAPWTAITSASAPPAISMLARRIRAVMPLMVRGAAIPLLWYSRRSGERGIAI